MKALIAGIVLALSFSTFADTFECKDAKGNIVDGSINHLKQVMRSNANRPQVLVTGTVTNIQAEDHNGLAHQKYSMRVDSSIQLLIVSNLEFGRIPLAVGKTITVCGEYKDIGNSGMVHWTHFDPHGPHADGFSILEGKIYGNIETPIK